MRALVAASCLLVCTILIAESGAQKGKKKESTLGTPRREDVPKYIEQLKKSQVAKDRAIAAEMIGKRGAIQVADVKEALPLLQTSATKDVSAEVRKAAVTALGVIGTDPENSVPPLKEALKDKSEPVQLSAVSALGAFGPEARSALPELREFAKAQTDKNTKKMVADSINKILAKPPKKG